MSGRISHSGGCGYVGPATWDGQCPECKSRNIRDEFGSRIGETFSCTLKSGARLGDVTLIRLEQNTDGRYNGLALVQPHQVAGRVSQGRQTWRDGRESDQTHVGTVTLAQ